MSGCEGQGERADDPALQDPRPDQHRAAEQSEHARGEPLPVGRSQRHVLHAHLQEPLAVCRR